MILLYLLWKIAFLFYVIFNNMQNYVFYMT